MILKTKTKIDENTNYGSNQPFFINTLELKKNSKNDGSIEAPR